MTAQSLFKAGRLGDAIGALSAELRDNPTDAQRRTFLFELLCFAGSFDRAEQHDRGSGKAAADRNQMTGEIGDDRVAARPPAGERQGQQKKDNQERVRPAPGGTAGHPCSGAIV